ncbi:MAG: serine/threonine-protein kinase [Gordonia sp. (in: high G+C Gram-positive bacteria)]|uniref:serine/threonine-protein kinase n=1 Tax=Gordonia sp. (in: high G+C Gram-positive bacteria) TaxID=84139 RepID=UPI003C794EC1
MNGGEMFQIGDQIAGYRVEQVLGAGGMGEVYKATHPRLPRSDAIKVLRSAHAEDPVVRQRFDREADLLAPIAHPNLVRVYDRGVFGDVLWIAMELVPGTDASKMSKASPAGMDPRLVVNIVNGVAAGLDVAHRHGVLHRDIKPANILVTPGADPVMPDAVKVTDFGIAQALGEAGAGAGLTHTGTTVGTMRYCSPEQIDGRRVDGRADIYSLAATAFELLTGSAPFDSGSLQGLMTAHLFAEPPRASERTRSLPPSVDDVLRAGLAKDPAGRPPTASAFAQALQAAFTGGRVNLPTSGHMFANTTGAPVPGPQHANLQARPAPASPQTPTKPAVKRRGQAAVAVLVVMALGALVGVFMRGGGTLQTPDRPEARATATGIDLTWRAVPGAKSYVVKQNDQVVHVGSGTSVQLNPWPGTYRYSVSARSQSGTNSDFSNATEDVVFGQKWRGLEDIIELYPDLLPSTPVSTDGYQKIVCQGLGPLATAENRRSIFCNKPNGDDWVKDYDYQIAIYSYADEKSALVGAGRERFAGVANHELISTAQGDRVGVDFGLAATGGAQAVMSYFKDGERRGSTYLVVAVPNGKSGDDALDILRKLPI